MAQFTSSAAKCSHMSSSGRTKNCRAGFRQWALHAAIPVLHHILEWEQCQCHVSLQQLGSTSRTIWETSCCSHSIILDTPGAAAPREPLGAGSKHGWVSTRLPEMYLGTKSSKSLCYIPKISWRGVSERIQSPAQYWVSHQAKQEARKKLIRRDNNVPKCCVNILKLNIYSKVN